MKRGGKRSQRPAIPALLILIAALVLALAIGESIEQKLGVVFPMTGFALLQGLLACVLAYMCGLAWWWSLILGVFPLTAMLLNHLQLPPILFLGIFFVLLIMFWPVLRGQVPFYPSGAKVWQTVETLLPTDKPFRFIDIGSGFGGVVTHLSACRPNGEFTGVEIAPLPWFCSFIYAKITRNKGRFVRGDYTKLDFAKFDVVFAYLSPVVMSDLWEKASAEMVKGSLLLSYEFILDEKKPDIIIKTHENGETLYGWSM